MDLTEAFAPPGGGRSDEQLPKTDYFDFVVSPPPHCPGVDGTSDEESFLHRAGCRGISFLHDTRHHDDHDSGAGGFVKETNNNTLTALPPVSTITGSLGHHNHHRVRNHVSMDQSDCEFWTTTEDGKEQSCNILLEDLNKYCWTTTTQGDNTDECMTVVHQRHQDTTPDNVVHHHRSCATDDRQNTDGAIYTLTVLNNEANSMDGLECCKSPPPVSTDNSWTLRTSNHLDLDAILSMESSSNTVGVDGVDHDRQTTVSVTVTGGRGLSIPTTRYTTEDPNGFGTSVEADDLCGQVQANTPGDNNNDWKLSDRNSLQDTVTVTVESAESLLRNALQGKLYTGSGQLAPVSSSSSVQASSLGLSGSVSAATGGALPLLSDAQAPDQQSQDETLHTCSEEDLLLSQLDTTTYRPGDYEKLKSIANEVVESYCNLEPVCNISATTVMYTLDPTSGSLGTITLPADLAQVGTVTVVTAPHQDVLQASSNRDVSQQAQTPRSTTDNQMQITSSGTRAPGTKSAKKYCRRANRNGTSGAGGAAGGSAGVTANAAGGSGVSTTGQQPSAGGAASSPASVQQRKERSLHYCSICSKGFKDKYSVNVHIRTHTGEKPFACSLCGKSFRQKAHLAKHYQTHVAQKPNVSSSSSVSSNGNSNSNPSPGGGAIASPTADVQNAGVRATAPQLVTADATNPTSCNMAS